MTCTKSRVIRTTSSHPEKRTIYAIEFTVVPLKDLLDSFAPTLLNCNFCLQRGSQSHNTNRVYAYVHNQIGELPPSKFNFRRTQRGTERYGERFTLISSTVLLSPFL